MPSYAQRRAASLARPAVDLRHYLTSVVRQQGPRPLCVPFSLAAAHEAVRRSVAIAGARELAVEPIWQHCLNAGHAGHNGTTLDAGGEALRDKGQTCETDWPYNSTLGAGTESEPQSATDGEWYSATTIDVPLAHDGVEDLLEDVLEVGCPIVLVVEITSQFELPESGGEIATPPLNAPVGDYHAVLILGTGTNADSTARRLLARNSWGQGWGAGGYGWLPLDYLIAFAVQAAAIDPASLASTTSGGVGP